MLGVVIWAGGSIFMFACIFITMKAVCKQAYGSGEYRPWPSHKRSPHSALH